MAYTCKDLTLEEVVSLEKTGVLNDLYLKSEKYLDGDKNFNYANCELTTEQFNNLTQDFLFSELNGSQYIREI